MSLLGKSKTTSSSSDESSELFYEQLFCPLISLISNSYGFVRTLSSVAANRLSVDLLIFLFGAILFTPGINLLLLSFESFFNTAFFNNGNFPKLSFDDVKDCNLTNSELLFLLIKAAFFDYKGVLSIGEDWRFCPHYEQQPPFYAFESADTNLPPPLLLAILSDFKPPHFSFPC